MKAATVIIIAVCVIPFSFIDYAHFPYSDGAEHGAAVRTLAENLHSPGEPMLNEYSGKNPRYVPSIYVMAVVMRLLNADIITTLNVAAIVFFFLFIISSQFFFSAYFSVSKSAALTGVAAMLFLWGSGWRGANAYMYSELVHSAYYPSVVSFSLSLLALYFQLTYLQRRRPLFAVLHLLAAAAAFVNHPLTGCFLFVCCLLVWLEHRTPVSQTVFYTALAVLVSITAVLVWPYGDFLSTLTRIASGGMSAAADYQSTRNYLYSSLVVRAGTAVAAAPVLFLFLLKKRYSTLVFGFIVCSIIYAAGYVLHFSLAERFVFFCMFFLQASFASLFFNDTAKTLLSCSDTSRLYIRRIAGIILYFGIAIQAALLYNTLLRPAFTPVAGFPYLEYKSPNTLMRSTADYLGKNDVVLSDIYTSWSLPVYTGAKIVALFHTPPHVPDNRQRVADVNTFFSPGTDNAERNSILRKYQVTHVLLDYRVIDRRIESVMPLLGCTPLVRHDGYAVFAVNDL